MHNNFWKKCFSVFVALLMIFSNAQNLVYAEGDGSSNSSTGDYNVEIKKAQYWNGTVWSDLTNGTTISNGTRVKIEGSYSVSNLIDKSEDRDIQIPLNTENLNVDNYPSANIVGGLGSYFEIKNNKIFLHLTSQYLQANSNIDGTLNIEGQVSIDDSKTDDKQNINIKLGDKGYTVIYDKYPNESSLNISKSSNGNVSLENEKFYQSYSVTLDARNGDVSIESLNDIYDNNVQEISGGFDVTYNDNNTVHVNSLDEIASSTNPYVLKNGQNLKITYRTQVLKDVGDMMLDSFESDSKNGFTAQYKTNKDNEHTTPEVNAHVNVTKPSVTKNGVYSDGKIEWTVTINVGSYKELTDKKLSDLINGEINDVTSDNIKLSKKLTVSDFKDNKGNGEYTATYTTDIVNKDSMKDETATNTVDFKIDGKEYSTTGTVTIPAQNQIINKSFDSVDLDTKTLNWKVNVTFIENMSTVNLTDQADHQQLDNSVNYIKLDDKVLLENGELTADGHKVFQSVNKEWHGAKLLFNDQYVEDHAGETKSFWIKTYVDSFAETTYENTAKLDYSYDNHNYNQESKAAYKNVNLLRKDGVVNQQTDQIDYTLTSYLTDISGLKAGDTVSIIDNLDNNFVIKNNKGSISAEYVSIQSQYYSAAIDTIHPAVTYDHNSHTFNYVVTQEFLDYVASKPDSANTDNRFGLRIKYSAVPENLSDFYKDNSNGVNITNKAEIKVNDKGLYSTSTNTNIKPKEILNKVGTNINGNTKLNYAIYTVTVNPNGIILNNGSPLTGVDSLNKNFSYILDSIRVVNASNGQSISEDHFSYQYSHENNTLTFTLPDGVPIKITYEASINLPKDTELDNNNSGNTFTLYGSNIKSDNTKTYSFSGKYEPTMTIDGETANLSVHKYDFDNNKVNLDGAKFSIYECKYDSTADEMTVSKTPFAFGGKTIFKTKNGNTLVQGLHLDHIYKLVEVEAPNGYEKDSNGLYFYFKGNSFDEVSLPNDSSKFKINYFLNTQGSLEVSNKKQEDNKGNLILTKHFGGLDVNSEIFDSLKNSISFTVKNTDSFNRTISLNDTGWNVSGSTYSYELKNLPIGTYTVSENGQNVAGYSVDTEYEVGSNKTNQISVRSTTTSSISITNTYKKQTTSYSVQKVWNDNDNAANKRPSEITVQLQRKLSTEENYSNVGNVITLNNENKWEYTWGALDATDQSGNSYTYQAVEVGLVNGYISSSTNENNKTTITNTITSVKVSKVDITSLQELEGAHIQILDEDKAVEEWDSTSETHVVYGLETNKLYTLHETIAPDGYTLASDIPFKLDDNCDVVVTDSNQNSISENGSILLKDALTSIRILKVDAATNTPLAGAHIQIKDGETIVQEFNSTEDNAGIQINGLKTGVVYTLHESSAPANYTLATDTTFSLNADGSINLEKTNTDFDINNGSIVLSVKDVQISKTTYSVQKEWVDNNNALNNRPSTIQVQLQSKLGDGEFTNDGDAITLSQDNNWTYKWNDLLSSNAEGTKYTYQAVEVGKSENYLDPSYRYDDSKKTQIITNKSYPVVEISKINVLGDEIQGAVLTLVDTNKNEVARWTSGSEKNEDGTIKPHYVQVAPGTYTLHEESTPDNNYVLAQDITFTVNENGVVTMNDTVVDHVTMVDEYNTHLINVSKVDISGNEIAGASMKITGTPTGSESKITPIEWVSGSDGNNEDGTLKNHVVSLQPGNYTLEETAVPDGNVYVKAANINFTVNVDGTVKVADNEAGDTVTMVDYYSDHGIVISKQDVNGAAVKGALLKLFDKENNEIASWETDGITDHQVEVQPGTYTLHEEATPDNNYVLAQNITFTVNEKGKALINGKEVEKVVMVDTFAPHDVVISKTDLNGKELKGAKLEVTGVEEGGGEIEKISWISDGNTKNISVKPGTYTLHEEATPDNNYVLAQDITFKVDSEGTISVDGKPVERVTMVDDYNNHPVEISKTDVGGKELAGAQLSVVDTNGITIDSWTSSAKIHKVTVKPGTYTLHEDLSPVGYKIAKDITFDVDIEGKVTVNGKKVDQVVMVDEDQTYDIAISKQDITNNKELPGAKLSLKDTKTNKVVETWTSASEAHVVTVVPSTYELSEVASPNGYEIAEKITFTVERDGTITIDGKKVETVIMQDQPTKPTVDTSDHNNIVFFGITGVISLGLAFMMLLTRKKIH